MTRGARPLSWWTSDDRQRLTIHRNSQQTADDLFQRVSCGEPIREHERKAPIVAQGWICPEIADVVVAMLCRLTFDFALWSERERMPPVLLVCEEAQRYVPASPGIGLAAAGQAITCLAREGRKYGISLALITQLPSELSSQALSQCGTAFALRLGRYLDHHFMQTALPDAARGMMTALPSMRTQEAIAFGEGVPLPMHIRFDDLPPEHRPRSDSAEFSKAWQADPAGGDFLKEGIRRWRKQSRAPSKK